MASNAMPVGPPIDAKDRITFGTDGIRGKVGTVLTSNLAFHLGYWSSHVLTHKGPIIIGQDSRNSGNMISEALTKGLIEAGREVWLIGLCPTPAIPHLIKTLGASGGFMVSASHNPPEDNGIKVFDCLGEKLNSEKQLLIESKLRGEFSTRSFINKSSNPGKSYSRNELLQSYQEKLLNSVKGKSLQDIPIVLDLCWGASTACAAKVFESLGADLFVINGQPNGNLINVDCGSTHLEPLRKAVIEKKASMGFAFDGDADRMLAVDEHGRVIDGDHVLYLWGSNLQNNNELPGNKLVATVLSNLGFEAAWKQRGGLLERTPVGDQNVHAAMIATGAALGGEQSGHILSAAHGHCGDGVLTALQIATICNDQNLSLAQWRNQSFTPFPQKLVNITLSNHMKQKDWVECSSLKEEVTKAKNAIGKNGRVLLRASGTEPLLRIMVEAKDQEDIDKWIPRLSKVAEAFLNAS